jgi:hypothetical protein
VSAATSGVGTAVWVLVALIAALAAAAVVVRRRRGAA